MQNNFHKKLQKLIAQKRITYKKLGESAGVTGGAIKKYEQGDREPTRPVLIGMAKALDVTVGWLAAGEQPKKPGIPCDAEDARRMREEKSVPGNTAATIEPGRKKKDKESPGQERQYHHPAAQVLDEWLQEMSQKDPIRSGYFLTELCQQFPEMADWIKERRGENDYDRVSEEKNKKASGDEG